MTTMLPTLDDVRDARRRIEGAAIRTPLVRLNVFDAPAEIYLKLENLQPIGSFKIRGASNAIARLSHETLAKGVLTASAGNMAQGVAWRARELGVPCTVVTPDTAPETKLRAIERLGGRVIKAPFEKWWSVFESRAYEGVDAHFVHAFDDVDVMAGNGTIALEIIEGMYEMCFDTIIGATLENIPPFFERNLDDSPAKPFYSFDLSFRRSLRRNDRAGDA